MKTEEKKPVDECTPQELFENVTVAIEEFLVKHDVMMPIKYGKQEKHPTVLSSKPPRIPMEPAV